MAAWPPGLDLRTAKALLNGHCALAAAFHSSSSDLSADKSLAAACDAPSLAAFDNCCDRQALAGLVELHERGDKVYWPPGFDIAAARLFLTTPSFSSPNDSDLATGTSP